MSENKQSRKWFLTINNPEKYNLNRDNITDTLMKFKPSYFCLADEISSTGTPHTHVFIYAPSPIRFSTLKNRFPNAHIDNVRGSVMECRDYIRKDGKWAESEKQNAIVENSFYEWGDIPKPNEEFSPGMSKLIESVEAGMTTYEIIKTYPKYGFRVNDIDAIRQTILENKYRKEKRNVVVAYIYGPTGTGKTRTIFESFSAEDVCRITTYNKNNGVRFDGYHGQKVIVFEEYNSQIPLQEFLNYLDIYPVSLPARYHDRVACYHHIFITSNLPLRDQYSDTRYYEPEVWNALYRRIHYEIEFTDKGEYEVRELNERIVFDDGEQEKTTSG